MALPNGFMYEVEDNDTYVEIKVYSDGDLTKIYGFPKGRLYVTAHSGDNQSVDFRLLASRKNILTIRYDKFIGEDYESATAAIDALSEIL